MDNRQEMFDRRYQQVLERHRQLSRGYVTRLASNGVVRHEPRPVVREGFPYRYILMPLTFAILVKAGIALALGTERYSAHLALLNEGTWGEKVAAFLMQLDQATMAIVSLVQTVTG